MKLMLSCSVLSSGVQTFQTNTSVRSAWRDGEENSSSLGAQYTAAAQRDGTGRLVCVVSQLTKSAKHITIHFSLIPLENDRNRTIHTQYKWEHPQVTTKGYDLVPLLLILPVPILASLSQTAHHTLTLEDL